MTTPDGVEIAVHDLGGTGPEIVLAHATGFHSMVFAPLARELEARFHCFGLDLRGHGRSGVRKDLDFHWDGFATDVLAVVEALGLVRPFGIGHSCGGAALLLAEERSPGTFAGLYCFEPVVLPLDEPPGPERENPMAAAARQRRETFSSRAEAYANYRSKAPLSSLSPDALAAYVELGFEDQPDGAVRLSCRREHEALVYEQSATHHAYRDLGRVACPVTLAAGGRTDTLGEEALSLLEARLEVARVEVLAGLGHFGPLERPDLVAASVAGAFAFSSENARLPTSAS